MSQLLSLTVSKSKYLDAISELENHVKELEGVADEFEAEKNTVQQNFEGLVGELAIVVCQHNIQSVNTSKEKVQGKITELQNYVSEMEQAESEAQNMLNEAAEAFMGIFD